jgi:hypothetical protein
MVNIDKIKMEETVRAQVQKKFAKTQASKSRTMEFLNSNLGLFILSTIFVSLGLGRNTKMGSSHGFRGFCRRG